MKILIIMDPGIVIPVKGYGGIERIIEILAIEHVKNGHEVHLLITAGSSLEGCTVHGFGKEGFPPNKWDARKAIPEVWKFLLKHQNEFDLIHNFGRLIYLLPVLQHPVKKIMSYQREITRNNIRWMTTVKNKHLFFTGCSKNLINRARVPGNWEVVYNACDFNKYDLKTAIATDAPLIFLGRIERVKGCHIAINVAKATGSKLIIAGNISPLPQERAYYEKEIAPRIDGVQIKYIGTVNDAQKNEWMGKSKALLFPIEWEEPFGIVMIEAMACGTPVIAFNRGAVNEVIDEGSTGFKVDTEAQMIEAVYKISQLNRAECRMQAKHRFDMAIIAKDYLNLVDDTHQRVVILSTHQMAANPRAMKEYETLKECGYAVKYLYSYNAAWSYKIDEEKFCASTFGRQEFIEVGYNPVQHPVYYFSTRILHKIFRLLSPFSMFCTQMSTARNAFYLWKAATQYPANLYIAHYLGALPAAIKAAKLYNAASIFDAEDFHRGEQSYYPAQVKNVIAIEDNLLPAVQMISTASTLITAAYQQYYPQQKIITINNVFSVKFLQPVIRRTDQQLKLFWFSQYIDQYRGLDIFIKALNYLPHQDITLTIMGNEHSRAYSQQLLGLSAYPHRIIFKEPIAPEAIFLVAAQFDIGLAGEIPHCLNKEICLSNKIFTYLLAGNAVLSSDMKGQIEFMDQYPGMGFTYRYNEEKDLADKIELLYNNRLMLESFKQTANNWAATELNWEHEKEKWLPLVRNLLDAKQIPLSRNEPSANMELV